MKKKDNKVGLIVLALLIFIGVFSFSYAIFTLIHKGEKENSMSTATLILDLHDKTSAISLLNAIPISDAEGLNLTPYEFILRNSGTADAIYRIYMDEDEQAYINNNCEDKKLGFHNIKYAITEDNHITNMNILSNENGLLYSGIIRSSSEKNFSLRLWIKNDANNEIILKHFYGKLRIEAVQSD